MHSTEVRGLVRFLYTHNPFYLLSAGLILYGLQAAFATAETLPEPLKAWGLAGALFGYATLMAVTGCLIVRWGGVWQDARSIVLILLLLFVAISTSFDQICNSYPSTAASVLLIGLGLTGVLSETVLRVLRIRFPAPYRVPYYLLLSLFFLYPLLASTEITGASADVVAWRIFLFPVACAAASLLLIPAIRKRAVYVKDNGTPWHWPWFPWTVFVFLAVGVCGRAIALTLSFIPMHGWDTPFGLYFLTPMAGAILLLLLEIALTERLPRLAMGTLWTAPVLVLLSHSPLGTPAYEEFVAEVTGRLGSPLWLALILVGVFYAYGWWRGLRAAEAGLAVTLLAAAMVTPETRMLTHGSSPQWWPLAALGVWQLAAGWMHRNSARCLAGVLAGAAGLALSFDTAWSFEARWALSYQLVLAAVVLLVWRFDDAFAHFLRPVAAVLLAVSGAYAVFRLADQVPLWATTLYATVLAAIAVGFFYRFHDVVWVVSALVNTGSASTAHLLAGWLVLHRQLGARASIALGIGLLFFVIAVMISALKGGIRPMLQRRLQGMFRRATCDAPIEVVH